MHTSRPWTIEEDRLILSLHKDGVSHKAIANAIGRTVGSVDTRLCELRKGSFSRVSTHIREERRRKVKKEEVTKPKNDDKKLTPRKCLRCGEMFGSTHAGNRICGKHNGQRDNESWLYDNYGFSPT